MSTQFEEIASDLPILSICENIATLLKGLPFQSPKVKVSMLQRALNPSRPLLIAPQLTANGMAKTESRLEEYLEVSTDHFNLCKIRPFGKDFHTIKRFLRPAIESAQDRIQENIGDCKFPQMRNDCTTLIVCCR